MADTPFMRGEHGVLRIYSDGDVIVLQVQKWSVKRNSTKHDDGVCGEDRDRLDSQTNSYSGNLSCFLKDVTPLQRLLDVQQKKDDGVSPRIIAAALILKPQDGSKSAFTATNAEIDDWNLSAGGRTQSQMLEIPFRAQYVTQSPGI